jgi:hypothetical protein
MTPEDAYCKARESGYTRELEEIACKDPIDAYDFARVIPGANIDYCQEKACRDSFYAYCFARNVAGANIEYCQEKACKDPEHAYWFAYVPGANIEYCQKHACKDPRWAYYFARDVSGADLNYCLEACKETEYYAKVQVLIMEEAIG